MSILSTIKDALHIGGTEENKDDEPTEEKPQLTPDDIEAADLGVPVETSSNDTISGEAKVDVDYWTKKLKAELYMGGVANDVVSSIPLELNAIDQRFMSITVPAMHLEKSKKIALEVLGDEKYFAVHEK